MKKHTFRTICLVLSVLGMAYILNSSLEKAGIWIGAILCILLVVFAYISTSRWGSKYFGGDSGEFG